MAAIEFRVDHDAIKKVQGQEFNVLKSITTLSVIDQKYIDHIDPTRSATCQFCGEHEGTFIRYCDGCQRKDLVSALNKLHTKYQAATKKD